MFNDNKKKRERTVWGGLQILMLKVGIEYFSSPLQES